MGSYLIGIDSGTSGCKACVFDLEGNLLGSDYKEYPCYYPHPSWVEQSPEDMVPAVFHVCKEAIRKSKVDPKEILALGLSTQASVIAMLDKNGDLIRPFVSWQDIRGTQKEIDIILNHMSRKEFYHLTGDPLGMLFSITKLLWLRENEPENWAKTELFSTQQDYFLKVFGADGYYTDIATATRDSLVDIDNACWSKDLLDLVGIPESKRPKIILEAGKIVGHVTAKVAAQCGLLEGTPLCLATFDQNCNTFGAGGVEDGTAVMVMGTFGSCFVVTDKSIRDPKGRLVVKNNVGMGNYTIEAFSNACAASYRWYRDTFGEMEKQEASRTNADAYDLINDQISNVPPGANGITFLPYLQGASGCKLNDKAQGAFVGMTLGTSKADMARAVMEGVCYEMYEIINAELEAGIELNGIRLTGGAAKSPLWCQMLADITKQPIYLLNNKETGCLGAAMYAGVGIGIYKDCRDAAVKAVQLTDTYMPNPDNYDAYDAAYKRFLNVYDGLDGKIF